MTLDKYKSIDQQNEQHTNLSIAIKQFQHIDIDISYCLSE